MLSDEMAKINDEQIDLLLCTLDHDLTRAQRDLDIARRREGLFAEALRCIKGIACREQRAGSVSPEALSHILETIDCYHTLADLTVCRPRREGDSLAAVMAMSA